MEEEKTFKVNNRVLNVLLGIVALSIFVIESICLNFGVASGVFYGIMSIFVYALSLTGIAWAYLREKKPSFEFWFNVAVFVFTIGAIWY